MKHGLFIILIFSLLTGWAFAALDVESKVMGSRDPMPYLYLRVTVRNHTSKKLGFDVTLKDIYTNAVILIKDQEIAPQKDKIYNLALPMMKAPSVEVVDSDGVRIFAGSGWDFKDFLNICDVSGWASEEEIKIFTGDYSKSSPNAVSQLEPDILPDNWLCYTPFQAVFIKESIYNYLDFPEKEALLQWVDSGGCLIVYGSDQNKEINQMLGTIRFQPSSPLEIHAIGNKMIDPPWEDISKSSWLDAAKSGASLKAFPFMVKKSAGKYGGFLLAIAFLIVAGPLNYSFWKKRKRIRMILISLPVISMAFCLMIILYFITTQGFAKKGGSFSLTILDEKRDAGITFSRHCLFSGIYPLGGFSFDRTTGFYPLIEKKNFTMDITRSQHLKSGLFTPSVNFHYQTVTPFKTRERLVYDPGERSVTNGFEQKIEGLMWNDGGQILIVKDLAPGQKKKMETYKGQAEVKSANLISPDVFFSEFLSQTEEKFGKPFVSNLINAPLGENRVKYMARFKDNPPSVQTGTRISAKKNSSFLVGLE